MEMKIKPIKRVDTELLAEVRGLKRFPQMKLVALLMEKVGVSKAMIWKILNNPGAYNNRGTADKKVEAFNATLKRVAREFK